MTLFHLPIEAKLYSMNKISVYKSKKIHLALFSASIFVTYFAVPLVASADTSTSVDAIMEQLKSLKATTVPKVSTTVPVVEKTDIENESTKVVTEEAPAKEIKAVVVGEETAPAEKKIVTDTSSLTVDNSAVIVSNITKTKKNIRKKSKKRHHKKKVAKTKQNPPIFDQDYMSLINEILNEQPKTNTTKSKGISGWIYLGRYVNGSLVGGSLNSGGNLPQVGRTYTVKSTRINLRASRPMKTGLGKLVDVLSAGDQVNIKKIHRSSRNNYWASVSY